MSPALDVGRTASAADTAGSVCGGRTARIHIGFLLFVGVLVRIPFYIAYRPIWSGDSDGYATFYALWAKHLFYLGERTPVYPFFLGFAQWLAAAPPAPELGVRAAYTAILLQSVIDILAAILFYGGLRAVRLRARTAFVATLFLVSIPSVCYYEMNILNMSFSFAWLIVVASLFLFLVRRIEAGGSIIPLGIATGIAASFAVLNRPEFLIFVLLLLALCALLGWVSKLGPGVKPLSRVAFLIGLAAAPAILAWMTVMYVRIGEFRITTLDGWNKSRTVYNLFDRVGPEDRVLGEIMSRTYRQQMQSGGVNLREIMWPAQLELLNHYEGYPWDDATFRPSPFHQQLAGAAERTLGWAQLSCNTELVTNCWESMRIKIDVGDYLGSVSSKLARRYPGVWLGNVASNFAEESFNFDYFGAKPSRLDSPSVGAGGDGPVRSSSIAKMTTTICKLHAPLLLLTYLVTLACFLLSPLALLCKHDEYWLRDAAIVMLAVASVGTMAGTCVLAGFNRVYTLPHLVVFTICTAYVWEHRLRLGAEARAWRR